MLLLIIGLVIGVVVGMYVYDCLIRGYRKQISKGIDELMALLGIEEMPRKQSKQINEILYELDAKKKRKRKK